MEYNWAIIKDYDPTVLYVLKHTVDQIKLRMIAEIKETYDTIIGRLLLNGLINSRLEIVGVPLGHAVSNEGHMYSVLATPSLWNGKGTGFIVTEVRDISRTLIHPNCLDENVSSDFKTYLSAAK